MAQPQPTYDLMLLLDLESTEDDRAKVLADAERIITEGGELIGTHDWGVREMAYEIRHQDSADYHLFQFHVHATATLDELDRTLSIADGVLRFRIIQLAPGTPEPPDPGAADARPSRRLEPPPVAASPSAAARTRSRAALVYAFATIPRTFRGTSRGCRRPPR